MKLRSYRCYKEDNLANWEANVNGTDEAWARSEKASIAYISFFTDKEAFAELKELKESGTGERTAPGPSA